MRYLVAGFVMAGGLVALLIDAAADDPYYGVGTSRWEHAGRLGTQPIVVAAGILAVLMTIWTSTRALPGSRPFNRPALLFAVLVYSFSWVVAWSLMGIGH